LKLLPILDEYTFRVHGEPAYHRSDNGSEFLAQAVQEELAKAGVGTLLIAPGSRWESGERVVQQPVPGRVPGGGAIHEYAGGGRPGRAVQGGLQRGAAAQVLGLSDPGGVRDSLLAPGFPPPLRGGSF